MSRKLFFFSIFVLLLWEGVLFAFTEMTPRTVEQNTRKAIHEDKQALQEYINLWDQQLSKIDTRRYTLSEALERMQDLTAQKKIPVYIWERGAYNYIEGNKAVYIVGENVFMRSQPHTKANIITKLNTETTAYLTYLGEWKHPSSNEKWFCVQDSSGKVGWVFEKYVKLISSEELQDIISRVNYVISSGAKKDKSKSDDGCGGCGGNAGLQIAMIIIGTTIILKAIYGDDENSHSTNSSSRNFDMFDSSREKEYCCPGYMHSECCACSRYDPFDRAVEHDDYAKCNHFKGYVQGSYSPQYNAKHVQTFEDECCPSHRKAHCRSCDYIDFSDESEHFKGYYKCEYFYAYVDPDKSPQTNSKYLKRT